MRYGQMNSASVMKSHAADNGGAPRDNPGMEYAVKAEDDAFATIVQWLHSRIPDIVDSGSKAAAN